MGRKAVSIDSKKGHYMFGMSQHEISRRLHISRRCILQTIRKHHEFHTVATKPGAVDVHLK